MASASCWLSDFPRVTLRGGASRKSGKAKAITATARKLAILVHRTLKGELVCEDPGEILEGVRWVAPRAPRRAPRKATSSYPRLIRSG